MTGFPTHAGIATVFKEMQACYGQRRVHAHVLPVFFFFPQSYTCYPSLRSEPGHGHFHKFAAGWFVGDIQVSDISFAIGYPAVTHRQLDIHIFEMRPENGQFGLKRMRRNFLPALLQLHPMVIFEAISSGKPSSTGSGKISQIYWTLLSRSIQITIQA